MTPTWRIIPVSKAIWKANNPSYHGDPPSAPPETPSRSTSTGASAIRRRGSEIPTASEPHVVPPKAASDPSRHGARGCVETIGGWMDGQIRFERATGPQMSKSFFFYEK